jgi:hypothetical protein
MATRTARPKATSRKSVRLLSGGNPQIAKADGEAPVRAYLDALPGDKRALGRRIDAIVTRAVPGVRKAVKWNSPFYGVAGRGFFLAMHAFTHYLKLTFFRGTSLRPVPPGASKSPEVRYLDLREGPLDEAQLTRWVKQAAALPGWDPSPSQTRASATGERPTGPKTSKAPTTSAPRARATATEPSKASKDAARAKAAPSAKKAAAGARAGEPADDADASERISQHILALDDWRGDRLAELRALILAAEPGIVEEWKWGIPVWSKNGILCTGEVYAKHVKTTFAKGAALPDPKRVFNASLGGNARRAIDLAEGDLLDGPAFQALIRAAAALNARGKR